MNTLAFCPLDVRLRRWTRRVIVTAEWLAWTLFFAFALSLMILRYAILPSIENYRGDIEAGLSKVFHAKVTIGVIRAGWQGLRPELDLTNVQIYDQAGRPALALPGVSLAVSWWSVPRGELRLHQLDISGADLDVRRLRDGRLVVGGIELSARPDGRGASDWLLSQRRIRIRDSRVRWNDETRNAPELALSNINLVLENSGGRHRLGLTADPPRVLASRIDLRADLVGESLDRLKEWHGETYADIAYIDLAAWRAWLDYPAEVQAGSGGVRAWAGFSGDRLEHFAADVALSNAAVRLRGDLPVLQLARVSGRIGAREIASGGVGFGFLRLGTRQVTGFEVSGKQIALATPGGVALSPADFSVKTLAAHAAEPQRVEMEANSLQLEPLARLIEHLPLDAQLRKTLGEFNPRGAIYDFKLAWRGEFDQPRSYNARGRFMGLTMEARGRVPGFANLSGTVDASEKGGSIYLASKDFSLTLPRLFEDPRVAVDSLNVQAKWAFPDDKLEVRIDNAAFAGADAAGTVSGMYRREPDGPGYVDLQAHLTRAEGKRVARYMPVSMSQRTRNWLNNAISEGQSDDARMILRGNLREFPFLDPRQGLFRVTVKARGATLHYADGWPLIENIQGDLLFERNFLEVHAVSGNIQGTRLGRVDVRMPDLAGRPHIVEVQGVAEGLTAAFLEFISVSPVDKYIDGFTETMRATGSGKLNLKMTLPIEEMSKLKIAGQFQFTGTDLHLDEGLPQISKLNGGIDFSEKGVTLRGVRGEALGGPFALAGGTRSDGIIALNAQGAFTAAGLRAWLSDPLFSRLSGGAPWRAGVVLRKKAPEIVIDSSLAGLGIDLPAPFAKNAPDTMPLKLAKNMLPARGEDEIIGSLGSIATLRLQRRSEGGVMTMARGAIGVGDALPALPREGLAVNVAAAKVDIDDWKKRLEAPASASKGNAVTPSLAISKFNLRADVVSAFGRSMNQVRLSGSQESGAWNVAVNSREVVGDLNFQPAGAAKQGKLTARLKTLIIPQGDVGQVDAAFDRSADELPSIDLAAEEFEVGAKKLGKLQLEASNQDGEWNLQKVSLENPDGKLAGSGVWRVRQRAEAKRHLELKFSLDTPDSGRLLDRLGFPGTVRGAAGFLRGDIAWDGSPLSIDYPSMRGNLEMRVEKGQFLKADPGVGKLLGIMSLQALPRRLSGDFRDVFSEGFSFDVVSASSEIDHGVLSTKDFKMGSVSAAVLMSGTVDLAHETQNLKVVVLPDLSGGMGSLVSILIGLNPLVSIATFLAQKALKDQISKAFSYEYTVSGTWADPKVARVQPNRPATGDSAVDGTGPGPGLVRAPTASGG